MSEVRPDDLKRSASGRTPQWVIDEAKGMSPTQLAPFRATTLPPAQVATRPKQRSTIGLTNTTTWLVTFAMIVGLTFLARTMHSASPGSTPLAITTERTGPKPGHEEQGHALGHAAPLVITSSSYRFLHHQPESEKPVTWSPCRPIHYVVRPDHAPAEGPQLISNGFATLAAATGLLFVDDGATTEGPADDREFSQPDRYGDRWAPVLVTWATADEVPDFGVDIAGEAGAVAWGTPSGDRAYVSGRVALDADYFQQQLRAGDTLLPQAIVLHELGHLVGLAHVNDATQVMYPRASRAVLNYAPGDLNGLAQLGQGPCQPDI